MAQAASERAGAKTFASPELEKVARANPLGALAGALLAGVVIGLIGREPEVDVPGAPPCDRPGPKAQTLKLEIESKANQTIGLYQGGGTRKSPWRQPLAVAAAIFDNVGDSGRICGGYLFGCNPFTARFRRLA